MHTIAENTAIPPATNGQGGTLPAALNGRLTPELRAMLLQLLAQDQPDDGPTIAELFETYAKIRAGRFRDWRTTEGRFRLHLLPFFGAIKAMEVNSLRLDEYAAHRRGQLTAKGARPTSAATRNRELASLRALLSFAVESKLIPSNPLPTVHLEREAGPRQTVLNLSHVERICEHLDAEMQAVVWLLFETGARRLEIFQLRWDELDTEAGVITLLGSRTKTGKPRRLYPRSRSIGALKALPPRGADPFLFSRVHPSTRHRAFKRAVAKAGIEGAGGESVVLHHLRHAFVTCARKAGVPDRVVQKFTGHTSNAFLRYGSAIGEDEIDTALSRLNGGGR